MPAYRNFVVSDDDNEAANNDLELLDYDSDASEPEITAVFTKNASARFKDKRDRATKPLRNGPIKAPDVEIQSYTFGRGWTVAPGDTVELKNTVAHDAHAMQSGDFLRIKHIITDRQTAQVRLRGHRLRRNKYLGQLFDWKLNELAMVLNVDETDLRCPFIAGMEDIPVHQVLRSRYCRLTNKSYPFVTFRDENGCCFPASLTEKEVKQNIFHGGRLTCRVVNIMFGSKKKKLHSGIVRHLYQKESDSTRPAGLAQGPGLSRNTPINIADDQHEKALRAFDTSSRSKRRARSNSVEILESLPKKRRSPHPVKNARYTFGDVFCGAGGASQGAIQAGLHVIWGLDFDESAIEAYSLNHPGALPFLCNAHNFPPHGYTKAHLRVDILHLSPPCCYFSPAHTVDGPNDQANLEAIYTVGAILEKLKPRVATLEQTFGLATHDQHRANFRMLLRDIGKAGYNMRYKVQDLSQHGLVQQRKRLLIIAARRDQPLPEFPKPTHGPPGSGLKKFHYIHDALLPIERQASRPLNDLYHQPKPAKTPRQPYSSHTFLKGCITTSGPDSYHFSGLRKFTPRELSLFQSFPYTYQFTGGNGEATKQIGNAFPPIMAEAVYRNIAKTLEAFDNHLIGAEDDLTGLDGMSEGASTHREPALARSRFGAPKTAASQSIRDPVRNGDHFGRVDRGTLSTFTSNLLDGLVDDEVEDIVRPSIETRRPLPRMGSGLENAIEISSESEDEEDDDDESD